MGTMWVFEIWKFKFTAILAHHELISEASRKQRRYDVDLKKKYVVNKEALDFRYK